MDIDFDPAKDAANILKHGMSLGAAQRMDWDTVIARPDHRHDYGEQRLVGYGGIDRRLHCIVYVIRSGCRRIISLRKANNREIDRYEKGTFEDSAS